MAAIEGPETRRMRKLVLKIPSEYAVQRKHCGINYDTDDEHSGVLCAESMNMSAW